MLVVVKRSVTEMSRVQFPARGGADRVVQLRPRKLSGGRRRSSQPQPRVLLPLDPAGLSQIPQEPTQQIIIRFFATLCLFKPFIAPGSTAKDNVILT